MIQTLALALGLALTATAQLAELQPKAPRSGTSYVLNENDVVRIEIFNEPDLSTTVRILKSGDAPFPLVGSVRLAGLTVAEATERLRSLYDADYLVDPKLSLSVNDYAQQFVDVIGSVRQPGRVPMPASGKLDLAAALAAVGGLAATANPNSLQVTRVDGSVSVYTFAQTQQGNAAIPLAAGDRVLVGESPFAGKTITILGQVQSRGQLAFPLDGRLDLVTAIARAGGFTDLANPSKVSVNRGGQITTYNVKAMMEKAAEPLFVQPDDIIIVPERIF